MKADGMPNLLKKQGKNTIVQLIENHWRADRSADQAIAPETPRGGTPALVLRRVAPTPFTIFGDASA